MALRDSRTFGFRHTERKRPTLSRLSARTNRPGSDSPSWARRSRTRLAHAQGDEVVDDRPGRPRTGTDAHHLVGVEAGFERRLGQRGVDVEVAVQEQVAEDADREAGGALQDLFDEDIGQHGISSWR